MTSLNVHPVLLALLRGVGETAPVPVSGEERVWEQIINEADKHALTPLF